MKSRTILAVTVTMFAGMVVSSLFNEQLARGQGGAGIAQGIGGPGPGSFIGQGSGPAGGAGFAIPTTQRNERLNAINALRAAKNAAEKDKAKLRLDTLLKARFDSDLKQRDQEISIIEARVKTLKSILEKRRAARDAIIQLQLKVLMNEAQGLGFPGGSSRTNGPFGSSSGHFLGGQAGFAVPSTRRSAPGGRGR